MNVFQRLSSLILAVLTVTFSWIGGVYPVWAQTTETAPIIIDGRVVFEVTRSGQFSAQERADDANWILNRTIQSEFSPFQANQDRSISVEVDTTKNLPILKLEGNHLLSVTPEDTLQGRSLEEKARSWQRQLERAISQAKYERRPSYLKQAALISLLAILIGAILIWAIGVIGKRWIEPYLKKIASSSDLTSSLTPSFTNYQDPRFITFQIILNLLRGIVILATLIYISTQFPQTRHWNRQLRDGFLESLTSDLFPLGNNAYSVLDLIILIALLTGLFILARSVKRVLRLRVLSITGLSRPSQETIALIANYGVVLIGTLVILQIWGLDISSLTVFAGVLGVGIGLGIQGIAKEFVSGLVLMFERPIQVGDFVEVSDLMGTVEHISVRSTEITTLDRVSVILPNSRFLEAEVVNWSHGDPISRLHIPAGVAYGSDLELVRNALLNAAKQHSDVLSIPPPNVFFLGFGNSSLDFDLLAWISEPRKQFQIKSDLYFLIHQQFMEKGIEIPFPQRDLHLRTGNFPLEFTPALNQSLQQWFNNQSSGNGNQK